MICVVCGSVVILLLVMSSRLIFNGNSVLFLCYCVVKFCGRLLMFSIVLFLMFGFLRVNFCLLLSDDIVRIMVVEWFGNFGFFWEKEESVGSDCVLFMSVNCVLD